MRYNSIVEERGAVTFPEFACERIYMLEFTKKEGLPFTLKHWQPTVDAMLDGVGTDGPIYLMVDQSEVKKGSYHRRPGLHIDGYWDAGKNPKRPSDHRPLRMPALHRGEVPSGWRSYPTHTGQIPTVHGSRHSMGWGESPFDQPEAIILASSICASRAFIGEFDGPIGDMGDCSSVALETDYFEPLLADRVYAGNVTMLHETLAAPFDMERTVVRLNVPGWSP